jgi:hypothetical protein
MLGKSWIKVILFGVVAAVTFTAIALLIDKAIRPSRGLLFLDLTYVVYLILSLIAAVCGAIVSIAALVSKSRTGTLIVAFIVAVTISNGLLQGAYEIYSNEIFFDAPMFYADVIQIILNLIIYPAVAVLIWKLFAKELAVTV